MIKEIKKNKTCSEKLKQSRGFVILFAVTISAILLSIALGVANIALKEVNFGTSAKDTNDAFFAADTGIECALVNDKSGGSVFIDPNSPSIMCNSSTIVTNENPTTYWSFNISGLGSSSQSCAYVTVDKTNPPITIITSKGYNIGDTTCSPSNPNRIEREIKVTY